jgi:phospholipid/cholesterol/gamma-HCH transport system substrate-binding protein
MRIPGRKLAALVSPARPGPAARRERRAGARPRAAAAALVAAGAVIALAGCSTGGFSGIYSIPLPGGAPLGSHPYQVTAQFADVLDIVPQSAVQVNNVAVGRVSRIYVPAGSWDADIVMTINGSTHLPANAIAEIQQSSLLGEQYVALSAPPGAAATGSLQDHSFIPVSRTTSNETVEDVLGAMSLLFNDGGLNQIHTIVTQLNDALNGNTPQVRSVLTEINNFAANLNSTRGDITAAIDGLSTLSKELSARNSQIGNVLDNLTPGLQVFHQQTGQLVTMLNSLHTLSNVAVSTINQSEANSVADLKALAPILRELDAAGQALPQSLQILFTFPFTDQVLSDIKGDYLNAYLSVAAAPGTCVYAPLTAGSTTPVATTTYCPGQQVSGSSASPDVPLPLPSAGPATTHTPARGGTPTPSARGSASSARPGSSSPAAPGTSPGAPSPTAGGSPSPTAGGSPSASPAASPSGSRSTGGTG